ncbi:hypothetical protein G9A89_023283 [Geosiphon pyriformis]|nr:hypothetical protein G9A89_023283 [Geosiphon pyriformis]
MSPGLSLSRAKDFIFRNHVIEYLIAPKNCEWTDSISVTLLFRNLFSGMESMKELLKLFNSAADPGPIKRHLRRKIYKWLNSKNMEAEQIFKQLLKIAPSNPEYACLLGFCYRYGVGTRIHHKAMLDWYKVSAQSGDLYGQSQLGWCYRAGIWIEEDSKIAFYWTLKSAEGGCPCGACDVAYCYRKGIGTKIDKRKSFLWYIRSAKSGVATAQLDLARCHRYCRGTERDVHKALFWYRKAIQRGYPYWKAEFKDLLNGMIDMKNRCF